MTKALIVHVKSDVTGRLRCGRRSAVSISSTDYLRALGALAEQIRLQYGEAARICDHCYHAA